jgi:hypothetical protein
MNLSLPRFLFLWPLGQYIQRSRRPEDAAGPADGLQVRPAGVVLGQGTGVSTIDRHGLCTESASSPPTGQDGSVRLGGRADGSYY